MLNLGQNAMDKYLKLPIVSELFISNHRIKANQMKPSFKNKRAFYKCIDTLPCGPGWTCEVFEIEGDEKDKQNWLRKEVLHLWKRNPVECIEELLGNPAFCEHMRFAPERVYTDEECRNQIFDETWSSNWWWNLQVCWLGCSAVQSKLANFSLEGSQGRCYYRTCHSGIRQDTFIQFQRRQVHMAHISHHQEYIKIYTPETIRESNCFDWVYTCVKA